MTWLLDTNVISEPTKREPAANVIAWIAAQNPDALFTMSIVLAELRAGIELVVDPVWRNSLVRWLEFRVRPMFAGRVIETDESVWLDMLLVQRRAKRASRTVPVADLVLAAGAERHGLIIVTRNVRDFVGTGVRVLNPWLPSPTPEVA